MTINSEYVERMRALLAEGKLSIHPARFEEALNRLSATDREATSSAKHAEGYLNERVTLTSGIAAARRILSGPVSTGNVSAALLALDEAEEEVERMGREYRGEVEPVATSASSLPDRNPE